MVNKKTMYLTATLMIIAAAGIIFAFYGEFVLLWESIKEGELHPFYLIGAFFILPVFGFPVSPLLVLMGVRFGPFAGLALVLAIIPFHLTAAFWISHSVLHKHLQNFLNLRSVTIPTLPDTHRLKYSILFMALPGLAYSIKNYVLPLSGLPFFHFMLCGWAAQGVLAVPFVVFGGAASKWGAYLFPALAVLIGVSLIFGSWIKSTYNRTLNTTDHNKT
jgi:uncharacterized membrane protein YdjX (TVP38/TMEM64 family)